MPCPLDTWVRIVETWGLGDKYVKPYYNPVIICDEKEVLGLILMYSIHPEKEHSMVCEYFRWKPGLSARRKLEGAYVAAEKVGSMIQVIGYTRREDYKFFNKLKELGSLRKVGKQSSGFGEMVTAWETPLSKLTS